MITKVNGEEHFQVLATNFTISSSNEGYTLMFSADGNNFSALFSVGAGVERMVTSVAKAAFYYLAGNQSEVSINWLRECGTGGGGNIPVASETTLGGIKVGDGLSIDGDGKLSAQGGGKTLILSNATARAEAYSTLVNLSVDEILEYRVLYPATVNHIGQKVYLNAAFSRKENDRIYFYLEFSRIDGSLAGYNKSFYQLGIGSDGSEEIRRTEFPIDIPIGINDSSAITWDSNIYSFIADRIINTGVGNIYLYKRENLIINNTTLIKEGSNVFLYAEWHDNGKTMEAKWQFSNNSAPIYWREKRELNYQIVDTLGNVQPTAQVFNIKANRGVDDAAFNYVFECQNWEGAIALDFYFADFEWYGIHISLHAANGGIDIKENNNTVAHYTWGGAPATHTFGTNVDTIQVSGDGDLLNVNFTQGTHFYFFNGEGPMGCAEGQLAYATDTHELSIYKNSQWNKIF